ncbi:sulfatase family protein [Photobacterium sp. DNB22_13_2]
MRLIKNPFNKAALALCTILAASQNGIALAEQPTNVAPEQPNIVMIFADDLHYGALGATGSHNTKAKTPHIDSIYENGVGFNHAYATHSTCAPSRAGLMTGRYQARFDFEILPGPTKNRIKNDFGVNVNEVMMSNVLQDAGYETYAIGKWHLGTKDKYQPNARGFDHWFGYRGASGYFQYRSELRAIKNGKKPTIVKGEKPALDIVRNGESVEVRGYLTEAFTQEAEKLILRDKDKPFFLYFAPYNVHAPDIVPQHYVPEGGSQHDGVIVALDQAVGSIIDALEEADVIDNTIIVFSNDNGGKKQYSTVFRGSKATYYEGGVRVPMAMQWGNKLPANTRYEGIVSTLDMLPTFTAAAGATLPDGEPLDGINLLPLITEGEISEVVRDNHYWRNQAHRAVRHEDWKLVWRIDRAKWRERQQELDIKHFKGRKTTYAERDDSLFEAPELYNLALDPKEQHDLSVERPEKLQEMIMRYRDWEEQIPKWRK